MFAAAFVASVKIEFIFLHGLIFGFQISVVMGVFSCFPGFSPEWTPGVSVARGPNGSSPQPAPETSCYNFPNILNLSVPCTGVILYFPRLAAVFYSGSLPKPVIYLIIIQMVCLI